MSPQISDFWVTEPYRIWTRQSYHRRSQLLSGFRYVALFRNGGEWNATGVENRGQISHFSPCKIRGGMDEISESTFCAMCLNTGGLLAVWEIGGPMVKRTRAKQQPDYLILNIVPRDDVVIIIIIFNAIIRSRPHDCSIEIHSDRITHTQIKTIIYD